MKFRAVFLFYVLFLFLYVSSYSQDRESFNIGVSLGHGSSEAKLLDIDNYFYSYDSFKLILNQRLYSASAWRLEIIMEPSYFQVQYKDYELKSVEDPFDSFNEYAVTVGLISRWHLSGSISTYLLGSTGPMYSDYYTSRMKNGIGFSNSLSVGLSLNIKRIRFDIRSGFRHVSNANLNTPNRGYNSNITEIGIMVSLQKSKSKISEKYLDYYALRF